MDKTTQLFLFLAVMTNVYGQFESKCANQRTAINGMPDRYVEMVHMKAVIQSCAPGTKFDQTTCECSVLIISNVLGTREISTKERQLKNRPNSRNKQLQQLPIKKYTHNSQKLKYGSSVKNVQELHGKQSLSDTLNKNTGDDTEKNKQASKVQSNSNHRSRTENKQPEGKDTVTNSASNLDRMIAKLLKDRLKNMIQNQYQPREKSRKNHNNNPHHENHPHHNVAPSNQTSNKYTDNTVFNRDISSRKEKPKTFQQFTAKLSQGLKENRNNNYMRHTPSGRTTKHLSSLSLLHAPSIAPLGKNRKRIFTSIASTPNILRHRTSETSKHLFSQPNPELNKPVQNKNQFKLLQPSRNQISRHLSQTINQNHNSQSPIVSSLLQHKPFSPSDGKFQRIGSSSIPNIRNNQLPTIGNNLLPTIGNNPLPTIRNNLLPRMRNNLSSMRNNPLPSMIMPSFFDNQASLLNNMIQMERLENMMELIDG